MEQTTSFAASLLSSVSKDTDAAAQLANMAMVDMADNSNKMGTSMQDIQNAYQGFAKQNYTMLDNLKLGYGGTQAEMQRLLKDAEKLSGVHYDLGNLADMYSAIHIIQQEMDITGTTAKEAATTLTGSFAAMKAAAENVMGNWSTGADLTEPLQALADTAQTFLVDNLLPMIGNVLAGIPEIVYSLVPELLQTGTELLSSLAQGFTEGIPEFFSTALPQLLAFTDQLRDNAASFVDAGLNLITQLLNGLIAGLPDLIAYVPDIIINICGVINDNMPKILAQGMSIIVQLIAGLVQTVPSLLANWKKDPGGGAVGHLGHQLAEHRQDHPHRCGQWREEHGLQPAERLQGRLFQCACLDQEPALAGGAVGQEPYPELYQRPHRQRRCGWCRSHRSHRRCHHC